MGLDLSALKKMGSQPTNTPDTSSVNIREDDISVTSEPKISIDPLSSTVVMAPSAPIPTASSAPAPAAKISLFNLKGGIKTPPAEEKLTLAESKEKEGGADAIVSTAHDADSTLSQNSTKDVSSAEAWQPGVETKKLIIVDAIVKEDPIETPTDLAEGEAIKGFDAVASESLNILQESLSINLKEDRKDSEVVPESVKKVEFFPNLDILEGLNFEDSILGSDMNPSESNKTILEIAQTSEKRAVPVVEQKTFTTEETAAKEIAEEKTEISEESSPLTEAETEISEETAPKITDETSISTEETTGNTELVTPEYVTEVKKDISEIRKVGGLARFKKIVVTVALTGVLAIGGLLGVGAILKHNKPLVKTNILETTPTTSAPISTTPVNTQPTPSSETVVSGELSDTGSLETSGYVLGIDYQVTPNPKKNIK